MVDNPEARSTGIPRVIAHQRQNYLDWLAKDGAKESVLAAYREACCLLVKFHKLALEEGWPIKELGDGIEAVAKNPALLTAVDNDVRLVIDNSVPDNTFINKHLPRLLGIRETAFNGMPVLVFNEGDKAELLPLDKMARFERNLRA